MNDTTEPNWERKTIEKLAYSALEEQKRTRRWGIFFKLLTFAYLIFVLVAAMGWLRHGTGVAAAQHTALIDVRGVIADGAEASADRIIDGLRAAFKDSKTQGVPIFSAQGPCGVAVFSSKFSFSKMPFSPSKRVRVRSIWGNGRAGFRLRQSVKSCAASGSTC